jgi:hypothetical protein
MQLSSSKSDTNLYRGSNTLSQLKTQNSELKTLYKLSFVVGSSSLAAILMALGASNADAQTAPFTIQSTGTLSGNIVLPKNNPNFNNRTTRIDTDAQGTYRRNGQAVYTSQYVQIKTRADGSQYYVVDFLGIPVVSFDGVLASPVLSGGDLTTFSYQGQLPNTKFQGVVQDEFGLTKAFYTGFFTDPKTGQQYQGTFQVKGQGPRYSDRNGGQSPTVFDFKSDYDPKQYDINRGIKPQPTVRALKMTNTPLVKLFITVPANAKLITPTAGGATPTPPPVTSGGTTPTPPPPVTAGGTTPTPPPVISRGTTPTPSPVTAGGTTPTPAPVTAGGTTSVPTAVSDGGSTATSPISPTPSTITSNPTPTTTESNSPSPTATPNMEFSSGNGFAVNPVVADPSTLASATCSQGSSVNCRTAKSQQAIGPRSRVLLR